jgi:hypothetical protein
MKLKLLLILFFFTECLSAQDTIVHYNNYKLKFGIKNIIDLAKDNSLTPNSIVVLGLGAQFVYRLSNSRSSIESGIYLITKGYAGDRYYNENNTYLFLSMPINFRYDTKIVYLAFGPYIDYFLKATNDYDPYYQGYFDDYRNWNLGVNINLGIEKYISKRIGVFTEFRSFINITPSRNNASSSFHWSYQNYGVALGLNYKILK